VLGRLRDRHAVDLDECRHTLERTRRIERSLVRLSAAVRLEPTASLGRTAE
jgi:hypothetical protein